MRHFISFSLFVLLLCLCQVSGQAAENPVAQWQARYSVAGYYPVSGTGRTVYSMNPAWRFLKGDCPGAEATAFDDSQWSVVSLPNGIEYLPMEASGCVNYQGPVWYRKHVTPSVSVAHQKLFLYFEAIMGKCEIWINGHSVRKHTGGYLPIIIDVTDLLRQGADNVIAVRADNSDDGSYPPGKPQHDLDFTYFGGIYRDCWLIAHGKTFITDANFENVVAGGGLFVSYNHVTERSADVHLSLQVKSEAKEGFKGQAVFQLVDSSGRTVLTRPLKLQVEAGKYVTVSDLVTVKHPLLWSPESPTLYRLYVYLKDSQGRIVDGYYQRIGIRSIEMKGNDGLWLNGKPYPYKLIGANRHQDFAIVGNALSNSMHWRDAKKLRDVGLKIIRNAHYPQDPSFMDACDELGLFVICPTPGWQFWNKEASFAEHVYSDIRQIVRRDRNRPSVFCYEPILNETWYPKDFAQKAKASVDEEYPYPYCYSACDSRMQGKEDFQIWYGHPSELTSMVGNDKVFFTREWGDNVDDWSSHNSPSRAARSWGEVPMLIQAIHYAHPTYSFTCYDTLCQLNRQFLGGCLWHSFDHQRGYHPDPFYGGLMDAFRQPKYSYYMFMAQRDPKATNPIAERGPMVYIANAETPFSPADVTVFSNCEEVRLTVRQGGRQLVYHKDMNRLGMPSPVITFRDVWHFMDDKDYSRGNKGGSSFLLAEGLIGGRVVATQKVLPARRPTAIRLSIDNEGQQLQANGSDMVTVVASIVDEDGTVKRLNNERVLFTITGEGTLVGDERCGANPCQVAWGTAPILVRSTTTPGDIRIHASVLYEGITTPKSADLVIHSVAPQYPLLYDAAEQAKADVKAQQTGAGLSPTKKKLTDEELKRHMDAVGKQQKDFE